MTISKYISVLLSNYETMKIETNHIQDGADKYGLFKSPSREKEENLDGTYIITEYYVFYAKQVATSELDRKDSDEWLEALTYWVDDYDLNYAFPDIDGNRTVQSIEITGSPNPMTDVNEEILYQLSLSITYTREKETI